MLLFSSESFVIGTLVIIFDSNQRRFVHRELPGGFPLSLQPKVLPHKASLRKIEVILRLNQNFQKTCAVLCCCKGKTFVVSRRPYLNSVGKPQANVVKCLVTQFNSPFSRGDYFTLLPLRIVTKYLCILFQKIFQNALRLCRAAI